MAIPSTLLPVEATALDSHVSKKRRHSATVDLTPEDKVSPGSYIAPPADHVDAQDPQERSPENSDDEEEDSESLYEDILDSLESHPYLDDGDSMSKEDTARLITQLRQDGIEKFFDDTVNNGMEPRTLGVAFGLDPKLEVDDDTFLRLLSLALVRAFHKRHKLPDYNTIDDAARLLKKSKQIMVITGAGISTSLGIPDFRSPESGFYAKVEELEIPHIKDPQDVFDIVNFDEDPSIFYSLAGNILPDTSKGVSPTHAFIRLLQDVGKLQTNYTQNVDNLEELAGLHPNKVIQCHGSFKTATCRKCKHKVKGTEIFDDIRKGTVPTCKRCIEDLNRPERMQKPQKRSKSRHFSDDDDDDLDDDIPEPGIMKPDITFFREQLPDDFFTRFTEQDSKSTDLVIVIGTSLKVAPVSEMPNFLPHHVPHIYISMEPIRHIDFDIQLLGKCDDVVVELCKRAGWDFTHKMVKDVELDVRPSRQAEHFWRVEPKEQLERRTEETPQKLISMSNGVVHGVGIEEVMRNDRIVPKPAVHMNGQQPKTSPGQTRSDQ